MNTRQSAMLALVLSLALTAGSAAAGTYPEGLQELRFASAAGDTLVVPFTLGTAGVQTSQSYAGSVKIRVEGTGQASSTEWSDAFYIFTDSEGNPVTPWHPTEFYNWILWINGGPADSLVQPIPAYNPDHVYEFTITAPGGPLTFAVGDAGTADNSGAYTITISPATGVTIIDLGTLGGGASSASAINERGQVVGDSETAVPGQRHAFLWTAQGGMIDLGTLGGQWSYPRAINEGGQVVGYSDTLSGQSHAFLWTAQDGMIDLGTLGGGYSLAMDINELGQVIGASGTAVSDQRHAFLWTAQAGMIDLGTLGGELSWAGAINQRGQVVGYSSTASGTQHAFLWETGVMTDLGTLGSGWSAARAINARGQVVGESGTESGQTHAFLRTVQDGMIDLGTLGGVQCLATRINEPGQVSGNCTTASGQKHAVIWTAQGTIIDIGDVGIKGGVTDLSNSGHAVGRNFINGRAFLWTPQDGMIDLGTLGGGSSYAFSINERGQIVGSSAIVPGQDRAVLWQFQGRMIKEVTEITVPIVQGTDDAGQEFLGCAYQTDFAEIYLGRCVDGSPIASGFRFQNVQIPRGAKVIDAYLEFTVDGPYENEIAIKFFGQSSPNALTFSAVDRPADRPVTKSSVPWRLSSTDVWNWAETHRSPDLAAIVQEIVRLPGWTSGNAMAFVAQSDPAFPANTHRRVYAWEREGTVSAARLIVRYASEPAPSP